MTGHIKLDRKILKWEWYTESNMVHLFIHLLINANFKNGRFKGILVKRGQLITGRLKLSKDVGLSEMQIRTCLNKLKSTNEITIKVTNKFSIITVCKYDTYQSNNVDSNQQDNQQPIQQVTNKQPTSNQQVTTIEECKEEEERKEGIRENEKFIFKLQNIYEMNWQEYVPFLNGSLKYLNEEKFSFWKEFVDFVKENRLTDLFRARFVTPLEFSSLVEKGFKKYIWKETIESILATGIEEKHNLFFRIPQFQKYVTKNKSDATDLSDYEKKILSDREKFKGKK